MWAVRLTFRAFLIAILLIVLIPVCLSAADTPSLVIDSGGSTRFVKNVIFTSNGKQLLSIGDDKVIRVWDVASAKTARTIRTQASGCGECVVTAIALSDDQNYLAVGGMFPGTNPETKYAVYLYKFDSGQLVQLLKGHVVQVTSLAFSRDGSFLAAGSVGFEGGRQLEENAIWIWKAGAGSWEAHQKLFGPTDDVSNLAFAPNGKFLVASSHDTHVRFWNLEDPSAARSPIVKNHDDQVTSIVVSPDSQYVASGGLDGKVKLWDPKGNLINQWPQLAGVASLAFSPDKKKLKLAMGLEDGNCQVFSMPGGEPVSAPRRASEQFDDKVRAIAFSPDGQLVASTGGFNGEITLWRADNGDLLANSILAGNGETVWSVGFAKDGNSIAFGTKHDSRQPNSYGPLEQVLRLKVATSGAEQYAQKPYRISLEGEIKDANDYLTTRTKTAAFGLNIPLGQTETRVVGTRKISTPKTDFRSLEILKSATAAPVLVPRKYDEGRSFRSFTLTKDGRYFISGGERGYLAMYDTEQVAATKSLDKPVNQFIGHSNDVWSVALSDDDQFLVSGSSDQTVRLWDVKSGRNILTIFVGKDREWVAWTTAGYYTSSAFGDKYFGWQVNRDPNQAPEFYSGSQFQKEYYRPDVIAEYFRAPDIQLAVQQADKNSARPQSYYQASLDRIGVETILPPTIKLMAPELPETTVAQRMFRVKLQAVSDTIPISEVRVSLNGSPKGTFKGDASRPTESKMIDVEMVVALNEGENKLVVVAENAGAKSKPVVRTIYYHPATRPQNENQLRQRKEVVSSRPTDLVVRAHAAKATPTPDDPVNPLILDIREPAENPAPVMNENLTISVNAVTRVGNHVELKVFLNDDPDPQHFIKSDSGRAVLEDVQVTLQPGDNTLRFVASSGSIRAAEQIRRIRYNAPNASKPTLIFLGIGISRYQIFRPNLSFADKDASDIAGLLCAQKGDGRPFADVKVKLITDEEADARSIIRGLNWMNEETKLANDIRVIMIAGHGGISDESYFFFPHNRDPAVDPLEDSIKWTTFWDKLKQRPDSKAFLFVDTCRAGAASSKDFVGDSERTGVIFFAAAKSDQNSVEDPNFRHGVFTQALLEGLRGQGDADADHNNKIDSLELENFIRKRVKELNARQTPIFGKPVSLTDPITLSTYPLTECPEPQP